MFVGFKQTAPPHPADTTFTPFNIGLDHIATACEDATKLHRVAAALQAAGVGDNSVKIDGTLQKDLAFKDTDRITLGFCMV